MTDLSIIIPAYNEAQRLPRTLAAIESWLRGTRLRVEVIIVDDRSSDGTPEVVQRFSDGRPWLRLLRNERNLGKGGGIQRGVTVAAGEVVFFMDADLSVPLTDLEPCIEAMKRTGAQAVIGSRRVPGSVLVRRQPRLRETMGRVFTVLSRILLHYEIRDFTCGFKGFQRDAARRLFSLMRRTDWSFDAELLYLARLLDIPVHQHPVHWEHQEGSRVRLTRVVWRTLMALVEIRKDAWERVRRHRSGRPV